MGSPYSRRRASLLTVVVLTIAFLAGCSSGTGRSADDNSITPRVDQVAPGDDLTLFLSRYAPPDSDDTTAYDSPRPPLVTRWLVYKHEGVRVIYLANGEVGDPPPYTWKFIGFTDDQTHEPIAADEALRRLADRRISN